LREVILENGISNLIPRDSLRLGNLIGKSCESKTTLESRTFEIILEDNIRSCQFEIALERLKIQDQFMENW
jgi:hypothetical protein